jgi:tetratricopeptide (TPR) repeat protein
LNSTAGEEVDGKTYGVLCRRYVSIAIGLDPYNPIYYHLMGRLTERQIYAHHFYKIALFLAPRRLEFMAVYALTLKSAADEPPSSTATRDAEAIIRDALAIDPNNYCALLASCAAKGLKADATSTLQRMLRLFPRECEPYVLSSYMLSNCGRHLDAIQAAMCAITLEPTLSTGYVARACAHRLVGNLIAAFADARQSLRYARGTYRRSAAHKAMAATCFDAGDGATALTEIGQCLTLTPYDIDGLRRRASYNRSLHYPERVLQDARTIIALVPTDAYAWNVLSDSSRLLGDIHTALKAAQQAVMLDKKNAMSHCMLGHALLMHERYEEAEVAATSAIHLARSYSAAFLVRASARRIRGNIAGAQSDMATAIELDPGLRYTRDLPTIRAA